jgi:N-dimethylarginine dimethylaminohydrolase
MSESTQLTKVLLKHARDAFGSQTKCDADWQRLNYLSRPDFAHAVEEYDTFAGLIESFGTEILWLPDDGTTGLDSIYVRDNAIAVPDGVVLCNMGKGARTPEPAAMGRFLEANGVAVLGQIEGEGRLEGGDLFWLDDGTVIVGDGYRTNPEGIRQLTEILGARAGEVVTVPLVHWVGPEDVFHLMSIVSPLAPDLALVYSRLMPVFFRELLLERGMALVEVPDEEFESMGCNVLALSPRRCLAMEGNPETRRRMEAAGCEVLTYSGAEISAKGCGGPTCLTRPLARG